MKELVSLCPPINEAEKGRKNWREGALNSFYSLKIYLLTSHIDEKFK